MWEILKLINKSAVFIYFSETYTLLFINFKLKCRHYFNIFVVFIGILFTESLSFVLRLILAVLVLHQSYWHQLWLIKSQFIQVKYYYLLSWSFSSRDLNRLPQALVGRLNDAASFQLLNQINNVCYCDSMLSIQFILIWRGTTAKRVSMEWSDDMFLDTSTHKSLQYLQHSFITTHLFWL